MLNRNKSLDGDHLPEEDSYHYGPRNMSPEEKAQQKKLLEKLEEAIGSYCEIRGLDNVLVFIGHIERVEHEKGAITIRSEEREMPVVIYNTNFKLMIRPRGGTNMVLNGKVCGSNKEIWKFDQLSPYFYNENRQFFRQPVDTNVYASGINALYRPFVHPEEGLTIVQARLCRVMDISLQGIQLRAKESWFEVGDWLLLTDLVLIPQQERKHNFLCQVRRTQPTGRGDFLLGCQFQCLASQEQDTLCADIFVLNRMDIQACRFGDE